MVRETEPKTVDNGRTNKTNRIDKRRRHVLTAIGLSALAGCMGEESNTGNSGNGGNDDNGGNGESSGGEPVTDTFSWFVSPDVNLNQIGYNPYNPTTQAPFYVEALRKESPTYFNNEDGSFMPNLIADWEVSESDETMTFTVEEGYYWNNGDEVTAEDFWVDAQIELGMYGGATDEYEDVTVDDEYTYTFQLTEYARPEILIGSFRNAHMHRNGPFAEFAEKFADASSDEEYESVQGELEEFTLNPVEGDDVPASGVFQIGQITDNAIMMEPNEHHPQADQLNFDQVRLTKASEWGSIQGMLQSGDLDYVSGGRFSTTFTENVPDKYYTYYDTPFGGTSIDFQLEDDIYGIREVRQAINHIVNKEQTTAAIDFNQEPDQYSTGLPDSIAEAWIDSEALDSFTDYTGQNFDEARALLESAGFEEGSDTWLTPDGEEWTVEVRAPAGDSDRVQQMEVVTNQLEDFGITAELSTIDTSTYWQRYRDQDWGVACWVYGNRGRSHPYFDFEFQYIGEDPGVLPGERAPWAGTPYEFEVPMPVGDPDGSLETVNYREKISRIRKTSDEETARELIAECAWIYNQMSFKVPLAIASNPVFFNTEDWALPDDYKETFQTIDSHPIQLLAQRGQLQAREE